MKIGGEGAEKLEEAMIFPAKLSLFSSRRQAQTRSVYMLWYQFVGVDNVFELNTTREEVNLHLCICINSGTGAKMLCFLTRQEQKKYGIKRNA